MEFLYAVVGIALGGLIAYYFSRQASKELQAEADALRRETEDARHFVNALISYLEAAGQIEVVRDEAGRPIQTKIVRLKGIASEEEAGQLTATHGTSSQSHLRAARMAPNDLRGVGQGEEKSGSRGAERLVGGGCSEDDSGG